MIDARRRVAASGRQNELLEVRRHDDLSGSRTPRRCCYSSRLAASTRPRPARGSTPAAKDALALPSAARERADGATRTHMLACGFRQPLQPHPQAGGCGWASGVTTASGAVCWWWARASRLPTPRSQPHTPLPRRAERPTARRSHPHPPACGWLRVAVRAAAGGLRAR